MLLCGYEAVTKSALASETRRVDDADANVASGLWKVALRASCLTLFLLMSLNCSVGKNFGAVPIVGKTFAK